MNAVITEFNNNLSTIYIHNDSANLVGDFFEEIKDAKTLYNIYNMVYEDINALSQNLTDIKEKYNNDEIEEFKNIKESMK